MQKFFRLFAVAAMLGMFTAVPAVQAEQLGTNPQPAPGSGLSDAAKSLITYTVCLIFGV